APDLAAPSPLRRRGPRPPPEPLRERVVAHRLRGADLQRVDRLRVVLDGGAAERVGALCGGHTREIMARQKPKASYAAIGLWVRERCSPRQPCAGPRRSSSATMGHARDPRRVTTVFEVSSTASLTDEDTAATTATGWLDRSERGKLALTGSDAKEFLQGQVSNDVVALTPGTGCYAAFLTPKGKMLGDLRVLDTGDELLVDTERVALQELFNMIRRFSLGHDVQLHKRTLEGGLF